jgi:hypothetical protein
VIKFVSDFVVEVGGFLMVLQFPPPIKLPTTNPNPEVSSTNKTAHHEPEP